MMVQFSIVIEEILGLIHPVLDHQNRSFTGETLAAQDPPHTSLIGP